MATTTNYGWTTPDDTALVKDGAAAIRTLGSSVDTTTKALNPSTTLGDIEYRSSTANTNTRLGIGSSGQVLTVAAGVPSWANTFSNPLTTTGDTIYSSSGTTPARLAIGSTGNILTVAGGVPTWAAPAASGGMTLISEQVLSASSGISFSSISGSYKQLLLVYCGIRHSTGGSAFSVRFNSDTASNYNLMGLQFKDTTVNNAANGNDSIRGQSSGVYLYAFGEYVTLNAISTDVNGSILIDNYASSTLGKKLSAAYSYYNNTDSQYAAVNTTGFYNSTSAITSVDIVRLTGSATISNSSGSYVRLYGIS
jgi:hypothetical protein